MPPAEEAAGIIVCVPIKVVAVAVALAPNDDEDDDEDKAEKDEDTCEAWEASVSRGASMKGDA
jgi:hypothetical protein